MSIRELFQIPAIFEWVSSFNISKSPLTPLLHPLGEKGGLGGICFWDLQLTFLCAETRTKHPLTVFTHMNSQSNR